MDFETRECGTRVIHIPTKDIKDFEINICGARGLQIDSDGKEVRVWRHDPLRSEDPCQHLALPSQAGIRLINTDGTSFPVLIVFG